MKTTQFVRKEDIRQKWYELDASDLPVGRVASLAAYVLRGKHQPDYTPHIDMGNHLIITNVANVKLTGRKMKQKKYYRHSGYPGGLKEITAEKLLQENPDRVIRNAVKGMLPKNRLGRKLLKNLRIYPGAEHPHSAQTPIKIELNGDKFVPVK